VVARGQDPRPVRREPDVPVARARFNLRPDLPDLALFPRSEWLAASRTSLGQAADTDLAYGAPFGSVELRERLSSFLARTRGVAADSERTNIFAGSAHALLVVTSVLRERGATRIAVPDPSHRWRARTLRRSGLELVPVPVDRDGLRVDALPDVQAVVVSPDHEYPLGAVLAPERRRALVDWAVAGDRLIVEHDYDGHFAYSRPSAGALQALAPEHVVYVGSASALLAPTLRLGWAVLPAELVVPAANEVFATTVSVPRLTQLALAELVARGYLDRHLRRARVAYRRRRAALLAALAGELPAATVAGAQVGLYVTVSLSCDEGAVLAAARRRGLALDGVNENAVAAQPPGVVVGFAAEPEPTLRRAVRELAAAVREAA
jgi:GntR family transcriptional regulator/MocR family aminotransferase